MSDFDRSKIICPKCSITGNDTYNDRYSGEEYTIRVHRQPDIKTWYQCKKCGHDWEED